MGRAKAARKSRQARYDFADIDGDFFSTALIRAARVGRFAAIGQMNGVIAVIFAMLGSEGISIISARPANRKERKLWDDET